MLERLMRYAWALLAALMFGCMPTLALAGSLIDAGPPLTMAPPWAAIAECEMTSMDSDTRARAPAGLAPSSQSDLATEGRPLRE